MWLRGLLERSASLEGDLGVGIHASRVVCRGVVRGALSKIWGQLARLTEPCGSRCSALVDPSSSLWCPESFPRLFEGRPERVGFLLE
jgi:hypothetical protein